MKLAELVAEYRMLLEKGHNMQLIEKFYDEAIVQVENNEPPVTGKTALIDLERHNLEGVFSFRQQLVSLVMDEAAGIVMGEMVVNFDSRLKGKNILREAFIQYWENGKIKYQRFYYAGFEKEETAG